MSRPLNKAQLLEVAQKDYQELETYLTFLSPKQITTAKAPEWSVKDILAHLYEWQRMFFIWFETGLSGETPEVPAAGYKWNQLPALNQAIFEKYHNLPLGEVLSMLRASQQKTIKFIAEIPDTDLTTPGLYPWMNKNTLMAYLNSITSAHFVWALKESKKAIRAAEEA